MVEKRGEIYKCEVCGNIVEVLYSGGGPLICCGKPMILVKENADDKVSKEKHVPIISGKKVNVGSIPHPMEDGHHIMWIEAESENNETARIFLSPGMMPEATFSFKVKSARAYCNLHGLWKSS